MDHRIRIGRHPVRSAGALAARLAACYTAERLSRRCRWKGDHHCGGEALTTDRARRYDEQADHWRQAKADHRWTPPAPVEASTGKPAPLNADYYGCSSSPTCRRLAPTMPTTKRGRTPPLEGLRGGLGMASAKRAPTNANLLKSWGRSASQVVLAPGAAR